LGGSSCRGGESQRERHAEPGAFKRENAEERGGVMGKVREGGEKVIDSNFDVF